VPVDADLLRRLYIDERLTVAQVAARLSCGQTTILRRLRHFEIPARPRGPVPGRSATPPSEWTADLAYAVGLIATDGNLSRKPGRLSITSNDVDLLDMVRQRLDLTVPIKPHRGGYGHRCHHIAWSDRRFYDWLTTAGLTPAKSLTLGPLAIPDGYFADFLRGCIDGDGSIITYVDRYNTSKSPAYVYTRLFVSIVSASRRFAEWLQARVRCLRGLSGSLTIKRSAGRRDIWCLRYAKRESLALLRWMYYAPDLLCLRRKRDIAAPFLRPRDAPGRRGPGRPMVV